MKTFFLFAFFILFVNSGFHEGLSKPEKKAKNIILLIGDGMGLSQVSAAFYFQEKPSNFTRFPFIGLHENTPTDELITDSASGATAFSAGVKTYNAAIGVDQDTTGRENIVEFLSRKGYSTGLVATSSITHATPASFYAHVSHRDMHEAIARQLVYSPVDFFAGGGLKFFNQRKDGLNYLDSLSMEGFTLETQSLVRPPKFDPSKKYGYLLAPDGMLTMQAGRGDFLPDATQMALDYLSQNKKGFFLMVEGSQIDWAGHANNADYLIEEVKDFDRAIGVALDFARKDQNTLVIVTADHETGGFSLSAAWEGDQQNYGKIGPTFSTPGHTATLIPVFAFGPGAENFSGVYQNSDLFKKMINSLRHMNIP